MDRFMWQVFYLYLGRVNRAGFSGTGMWWRTFVASPKIQRALSLRALEFLVCYQTLIFKYWGFWLYEWAAKNKLVTDCIWLQTTFLYCGIVVSSGKKFNHLHKYLIGQVRHSPSVTKIQVFLLSRQGHLRNDWYIKMWLFGATQTWSWHEIQWFGNAKTIRSKIISVQLNAAALLSEGCFKLVLREWRRLMGSLEQTWEGAGGGVDKRLKTGIELSQGKSGSKQGFL